MNNKYSFYFKFNHGIEEEKKLEQSGEEKAD